MVKVSVIVAVDENNAIGKDNGLLCHLPNDLKYFKAITTGHTVIMGRKTFESLPKGALPNRRNIVVTRDETIKFDNCEMCRSIPEAVELCRNEEEIFFIGGGSIYKEVVGIADNLYLTRIHHAFDGADTYFPTIKESEWKEVARDDYAKDEKNTYGHSFVKLEKIKRG